MEKSKCSVWVINDNATVAGETKEQVIAWYEDYTGMKVEMIEEGSLKEQYTIVDDGRNATEDIEVWKTVEEGIDDWFKLHRRQGKPVENPFVVCSFDC